ncbi:MAG: hypothetical protein ABJA70_15095, partial [Chryseolinea sp.]
QVKLRMIHEIQNSQCVDIGTDDFLYESVKQNIAVSGKENQIRTTHCTWWTHLDELQNLPHKYLATDI